MKQKRYGILDNISSPADLRGLSYDTLGVLCAALREFIVDSVSQTGGHLASNLGIVELAVALEREFDSSRDRIIYDVGHQCYVHKILTGRRDRFDTLRQYGGLCGFMKPEESITDPCITGHASDSVSVALGMAHARTLKNQKYHVVAVIGDGALTGGMAYEALSSAGTSREPLLVVLNDNNMSIAKNVGGLSRHLSRLRVSPQYLRAKTRIKERLSRIPGGGTITRAVSRFKAKIKRAVLPQYPEKYHGVSKFDRVTGAPLAAKKEDFSAFFGKELCALAEKDNRICAITAAMPSGTGLTRFAEKFPERFFDVGIAEEHAIGMAAGMAAQGLVPVAAIYSTFLQRAYDQIVHDIAIEGLHVVLCVDRAGIVGADGATHNGVLDIAFLRSIPGVKIFCPSDFAELRVMLSRAIYRETGPVAIRYPRGSEGAYRKELSAQPLVCVHEQSGSEVTIVTHGIMVNQAIDAAEILMHEGIRAQVYKVNEIGSGLEQAYAEAKEKLGGWCVVVEDVVPNGSVGEWFAAHRSERTDLLNTGDRFLPHGGVNELYRHCGIDAEGIAAYIMKNRNGKENSVG